MQLFIRHFILVSLFLASAPLFSQKKQLTPEDVVYMNPKVFPKSMKQLQWKGQSDRFVYVDGHKLVLGDIESELRDTLVTLDDINTGLTDLGLDSLNRFPTIKFFEDFKFRFYISKKLMVFDVTSKNLTQVNYYDEKGKNPDIGNKSLVIAYTLENNLFVTDEEEQIQISSDEDKGIVNGQSVHRNEFGIHKGTFWSPNDNYLAYYRKDETMVTDYPLG